MQYVTILRGINVGGKRKILMADLKLLLAEAGFSNIQTYIQSGNIVFDSAPSNIAEMELRISKLIEKKFGFQVPVIVKTSTEIKHIATSNPFLDCKTVEIEKLHVTFLQKIPDKLLLSEIEGLNFDPDHFVIDETIVFIYCAGKYHKSKLSNRFFENKLNMQATTRNWKTVLKLSAMCA